MSNLFYIDNEAPWNPPAAYGPWDLRNQSGGTIESLPAAAWPERGGLGLRVAGGSAYVKKNVSIPLEPGQALYLGLWLRPLQAPAADWTTCDFVLQNGGVYLAVSYPLQSSRTVYVRDDSQYLAGANFTLAPGRWSYLVVGVRRSTDPSGAAADGRCWLYLDGTLVKAWTNVDNYHLAATVEFPLLGQIATDVRFSQDFDEIQLATAYPEPYAPRPATALPCPRRVAVLYRGSSDASRQFADACVSQLGVPRANLINLPTASGDETLGDYAAFQAQVEAAIQAYFALNPTVAQRCTCFLIGHGVPGYFMHQGVKHSAVSRLMNFGTPFAGPVANPLFERPVARLSQADLNGKRLCARIDAADLTASLGLLDRAAASAVGEVPADQALFVDDESLRFSPACGRLRLNVRTEGAMSGDALAWVTGAAATFGQPAGVRAFFGAASAGSLDSLRQGPCLGRNALSSAGGYAAAVGFAAAIDGLDPERFFEAIRQGAGLAEAGALASPCLDSSLVVAGNPLMTVGLPKAGVNVYHGQGGASGIDWTTPLACCGLADQAEVKLPLAPNEVHVLGIRRVSAAGVEEGNARVLAHVRIDEAGQVQPVLTAAVDVAARPIGGGGLAVSFRYLLPPGLVAPERFEVLSDGGTGTIDLENPVLVIGRLPMASRRERFEARLTVEARPLKLCVRACLGQAQGPISRIVELPAFEAVGPQVL